MLNPRVPLYPLEDQRKRLRTRTMHLKREFWSLPISPNAKQLLITLSYFCDDASYDVDFLTLMDQLYQYENLEALIAELDSLGIIIRKNYSTITLKKQKIQKLGIKVCQRNKMDEAIETGVVNDDQALLFDEAVKVFQAYNKIRAEFYQRTNKSGFIPTPIPFAGIHRTNAFAVVKFLKEHKITEYDIFFYTLCQAYSWSRFPYLNQCHSPVCYDIWKNLYDEARANILEQGRVEKAKKLEQELRETGKKKSIFRDIYIASEYVKHNFKRTGELQLCMDNYEDTLGYHPKSEVCKTCRLATKCREKLKAMMLGKTKNVLNIIDLREGKVDILYVKHKLEEAGVELDIFDGTTPSPQNRLERAVNG